MNNQPKWKQVLKQAALVLASIVLLDWLLDGRLRRWLPGRRRDRSHNLPT